MARIIRAHQQALQVGLMLMLANSLFYLRGTARAWYETHEEELTSWDTCKQKLRDLFGRSVARQMAARQDLASRVQSSMESYVTYIQDVLALCRKTDKNMSEADKISNVLKGIADDAFNILMCKNCTTVDSIISECRRFEQAKSRRITHHIARLPNTAATSSCEDSAAPRSLAPPANIARIVRQELEAMAPASYQPPAQDNWATASLIQAVVRQEFDNLGVQVPQPDRLMPQPMSTPV
uniref:Putative secreted protein n=1 Tax=Rhipicephalus microplus TaxID=6941 RepID=A0A6G5A3R4_RHIMP